MSVKATRTKIKQSVVGEELQQWGETEFYKTMECLDLLVRNTNEGKKWDHILKEKVHKNSEKIMKVQEIVVLLIHNNNEI